MSAEEVRMEGTTRFQENCRAAVDAVLSEFGIETLYETHETHETSGESPGPGGSFLRTEFRHGDNRYDLYVYSGEAAVNINRTWHSFERHDHPEPDDLVTAFVAFLRRRLKEGEE
jgi:hypothetical protein